MIIKTTIQCALCKWKINYLEDSFTGEPILDSFTESPYINLNDYGESCPICGGFICEDCLLKNKHKCNN